MLTPKELPDRGVFRLPGVASDLDLLCLFRKSRYQGDYFELPNGSERVFSRHNVIEMLERRT
jgi:hypothetical protein